MLSIPLHVPTLLLVSAATLVGPTAHAATPKRGSGSASTIAVELVESGGKGGEQRVSFVVPIGGEIQAWVRGGDDPRFCRVNAHSVGGGEMALALSCARAKASPPDLEVKATRSFSPGKQVLVGQVARPDGRTIEVHAQL
jgi:hypothetical protein